MCVRVIPEEASIVSSQPRCSLSCFLTSRHNVFAKPVWLRTIVTQSPWFVITYIYQFLTLFAPRIHGCSPRPSCSRNTCHATSCVPHATFFNIFLSYATRMTCSIVFHMLAWSLVFPSRTFACSLLRNCPMCKCSVTRDTINLICVPCFGFAWKSVLVDCVFRVPLCSCS